MTFNVTRGREVSNGLPSIPDMRGIAVDQVRGHVFVASKGNAAVMVYDMSGNQVHAFDEDDPIGVLVCQETSLLYVTTSKKDSRVEAYDLDSFAKKWDSSHSLGHGAGMDYHGGKIYVVEQDASSIAQFNATTGAWLGYFLINLADAPEQVMVASC